MGSADQCQICSTVNYHAWVTVPSSRSITRCGNQPNIAVACLSANQTVNGKMPYFSRSSLDHALSRLHGTADHLFKIWLTLKQMGLSPTNSILVDTGSPQQALTRLFGFGDPDNRYFVPFAHTKRFKTMQADAGRSIIQTNLKRWIDHTVVQVDPTGYLDISQTTSGEIQVRCGRGYPRGLGHGQNGFALRDDTSLAIPLLSFCVWYYRQSSVDVHSDILGALTDRLCVDLNLTSSELELIAQPEVPAWEPSLQETPLSDADVFAAVSAAIDFDEPIAPEVIHEDYGEYLLRTNTMISAIEGPNWRNVDPQHQLQSLLASGATAILLYGPPRTGKTRAIDQIIGRGTPDRETIQIHDGWGYEELITGLRPRPDGTWSYHVGPLLAAIKSEKRYVVLEEINRTDFSTSIGEVFSLIESAYRGPENGLRLRNGDILFIPSDTIILCTMNSLDRSTEIVDDALFGRMAAVEFRPRVESLHEIMSRSGVPNEMAFKIAEVFAFIQPYYPLGHGYFADYDRNGSFIEFYLTRIRPVLQKHLENFRDQELHAIDEKVDQLFG